MIKIEIDTQNAAFYGKGYGLEISRLLHSLSCYFSDKHEGEADEILVLIDTNGNKVGSLKRVEDIN